MGNIEERLERRGIVLPPAPEPLANYVPSVLAGSLLFLSGQGPKADEGHWHRGTVGDGVTVEQAYQHARLTGLRMLAAAQNALGTLDRVKRVVKILGFVRAAPDFEQHPAVVDGCSDLIIEFFGERGRHARSAVGVSSLPGGITIEIEALFAVE